jgi:hypothetical protein
MFVMRRLKHEKVDDNKEIDTGSLFDLFAEVEMVNTIVLISQ